VPRSIKGRPRFRRPTQGQLEVGLAVGHPRPIGAASSPAIESLELRRLVAGAVEAQLGLLSPELTVGQLDFAAFAGRIAGEVVRLLARRGLVADIRPGTDFE
jgi:hypothetical protein